MLFFSLSDNYEGQQTPDESNMTPDIYSSPTEYFPSGNEVKPSLEHTFTSADWFNIRFSLRCLLPFNISNSPFPKQYNLLNNFMALELGNQPAGTVGTHIATVCGVRISVLFVYGS